VAPVIIKLYETLPSTLTLKILRQPCAAKAKNFALLETIKMFSFMIEKLENYYIKFKQF